MMVVRLAWYTCGICALGAVLTSAITYAPEAEKFGRWAPVVLVAGAILSGGLALFLRQKPTND